LFRVKDLRLVLGIDRTKAYNIVKALKRKGVIKKAGKNFLALRDADEYVIGTGLNSPSYVSFWSALNHYGFSDQLPKKIFLATTRRSRDIGDFKYVTLSRGRFFGYTMVGGVPIAEKEKAIIDSLLLPRYAGGINEIRKCLSAALGELDIEKLVDYALRAGSKAVLRRLGLLLESLNYKGKPVERLRKNIGKGYELLDPSLKRKNDLDSTWLLDVNC
jgi:predicted transcriptional regulator of viral defense system